MGKDTGHVGIGGGVAGGYLGAAPAEEVSCAAISPVTRVMPVCAGASFLRACPG